MGTAAGVRVETCTGAWVWVRATVGAETGLVETVDTMLCNASWSRVETEHVVGIVARDAFEAGINTGNMELQVVAWTMVGVGDWI